jgi:hypothetical protein
MNRLTDQQIDELARRLAALLASAYRQAASKTEAVPRRRDAA